MRYTGQWYLSDPGQKQRERVQTGDYLRIRGTAKVPPPPRDIFAQVGPRGVFVTWKMPPAHPEVIIGWRVYKDTESSLYADIHDVGTRQCFIETTSGSTPPTVNIFVSSVSQFAESQKVQTQNKAAVEAGAPSMPGPPPGYTQERSAGVCFTGKTKLDGGISIENVTAGMEVMTRAGMRKVRAVVKNKYWGEMQKMGDGELVTPGHEILEGDAWVKASGIWLDAALYAGSVWNLEIDTDDEFERNYLLANGRFAHNVRLVNNNC